MRSAKPFLTGVLVLVVTAILKIAYLGFLIYAVKLVNRKSYVGSNNEVYILPLSLILILLAEAFVYWRLRFNISKRVWVQVHAWLLFIIMIIFPFVYFVLSQLIARNYPADEHLKLYNSLIKINFYSFWFIFLLAHLFFVATIVRYFNQKNEVKENEAAGLLDEFIS